MHGGEFEDEQEALKGIVALLLGLAALAELLSVMPRALRTLLLPLLRHAEVVAGTFVVDCAGRSLAFPPALVLPVDGDDCAEALRLGRCLRALASIIGYVVSSEYFSEERPFRHQPDRRLAQCALVIALRGNAMGARCVMAFRGAALIDTS